MNEEAMAHWGLLRQKTNKQTEKIRVLGVWKIITAETVKMLCLK